jgi:L-glutamine-phosphate cytidylyltransferase
MKVIIIAAGQGSRLGNLTKNLPKSLLDINGKSILQRQIELFHKFGIKDIVIVRGPHKEKFHLKDVRYIEDPNYLYGEQVSSLMCAKNEIVDDVIISFGDIIFEELILKQLLECDNELVLSTDQNWKKSYEVRTEASQKFSDFVALKNKQIIKFLKDSEEISEKNDIVEFIGLMKLSKIGSEKIIQIYEYLEKNHVGKFHYATSFKKAKIIDLLEELRLKNMNIKNKNINGIWCEIDTKQDLEITKKIFK